MRAGVWGVTAAVVLAGAISPARAQVIPGIENRVEAFAPDETPVVNLWMEGGRTFDYGAPVRVWFHVNEDAHVLVARVDANGHLTVLYPNSRTRSTEVSGGKDVLITGRRGYASFYATDRMAGGFVFAMASYDPFDLSRLRIRDFDRYVTGMYVGRPNTVYIGDPHRVVTRFADVVLYDRNTPFDYAVDFYAVDAPYRVSSAGYSSLCNAFSMIGMRGFRGSAQERWDDELYYGGVGGFGGGMANCAGFSNCVVALPWIGMWSPMGLMPTCMPQRPTQVAGNPTLPPFPSDSSRLNPWVPDSATRPPDVGGTVPPDERADNPLRRQHTGTSAPDRPIRVADEDDDPTGRSYAIPDRALRNRRTTIADRRDRDDVRASRPDRATPPPAGAGREEITWVRPPRDVADGGRNRDRRDNDGVQRGSGRRGNEGGGLRNARNAQTTGSDSRRGFGGRAPDRDQVRFDAPPPRSNGPRFDSPPPPPAGGGGGRDIRHASPPPAPRGDSPSPRADPPPRPSSEPVRTSPPPSPPQTPPPPARSPEVKSPPAERSPGSSQP